MLTQLDLSNAGLLENHSNAFGASSYESEQTPISTITSAAAAAGVPPEKWGLVIAAVNNGTPLADAVAAQVPPKPVVTNATTQNVNTNTSAGEGKGDIKCVQYVEPVPTGEKISLKLADGSKLDITPYDKKSFDELKFCFSTDNPNSVMKSGMPLYRNYTDTLSKESYFYTQLGGKDTRSTSTMNMMIAKALKKYFEDKAVADAAAATASQTGSGSTPSGAGVATGKGLTGSGAKESDGKLLGMNKYLAYGVFATVGIAALVIGYFALKPSKAA